ncbi:hypothetical protein ACPB9E_11740 [Streptomyces exfoliatus]|uniref:hypothetical protein n=1 Tax=Streptomyces exfoliatus TaxID=1905 RepID=UPI003C301977
MTKNVKIGVALVGGYLLGRTKKAKLALGFGLFLAGRKLDLDPRRVGQALAASPLVGSLNDQVRQELVEATKTAATQALTKRATGLADSLSRRTQAIGRPDEALQDEGADRDDGDDEDLRADADAEYDDGAEYEDGDEERAKRASRRKAPAKKATGRAKPAAENSRRAAAGGPRQAADRTHKTATTTRKRTAAKKTGTSATRKARGGGDRG